MKPGRNLLKIADMFPILLNIPLTEHLCHPWHPLCFSSHQAGLRPKLAFPREWKQIMKTSLLQSSGVLALVSALLITATAMSGCGKQEFQVTSNQQAQKAPGTFTLAPKVDIVLVEDNTGSMNEIFPKMVSQMPTFLMGLEARGWDYHFATIPLTTDRALRQATASRHDSNYGSAWTPPYPGALPHGPGTLPLQIFRTLSTYQQTGFLSVNDISNTLQGKEPGLETIRLALRNRLPSSGFIREDALLVVLTVSNGNDTSGVAICSRAVDGFVGPCEETGFPELGTQASSLNYYLDAFRDAKRDPSQLKFFAAVANGNYNYCLGGPSRQGVRYQQIAANLGGQSYDICTQPLSQVLDSLSNELQTTKIAFRTRYLFVDQEPEPSSIVVTRFKNGDPSRAEIISQRSSQDGDGWSYAGYVTNVYSIDYPSEMGMASGYAIELHGSAKLTGDDTANVSFKPAGSQNTVSQ